MKEQYCPPAGATLERGRIAEVTETGCRVASLDRKGLTSRLIPMADTSGFSVGDMVNFFLFNDGTAQILREGDDQAAQEAAQAAIAAKTDAEAARDAAQAAMQHYPYIDPTTHNWMLWNPTNEEWTNTGIQAEGVDGNDGFSPLVEITSITGGYSLKITDKNGSQTFNVMDGTDGDDGVSPVVTITEITGGHRYSVTDKNGTQTFDVMDGTNGTDGDDGISPVVTITTITGGHRYSVTDKNGTQTFDVMDGQDADPTTLIDDNAGSGTTDKTWSANKLHSELAGKGTVKKVSTGAGLTGGDVTTEGTIKANLTSETKLNNQAADGTETSGRLYPVRLDANGRLAVNVPWKNDDTKNTAGSTDSSSKLFLIGATSQAANPQTYSQDTAFVGTDGKLYSGNNRVMESTGDTMSGKLTLQKGTNEIITGTGTAGQAGSASAAYIPSLWTFDLAATPEAGDILTIKIPVAGVNAGVWMSVDNGITYYPIATNNKTRLTTHYVANEIIQVVFETGMTTTTYGTDTTGAAAGASAADLTMNRWLVLNFYDSNTTYSAQTSAILEAGTNTSNRTIRADVFKSALKAVIKAGASDGHLLVYDKDIDIGSGGTPQAITTSDIDALFPELSS